MAVPKRVSPTLSLVLGWQVNNAQEPEYWVNNEGSKPGSQSESDLFMVSPSSIGSHTAIIAQSGSGKSYFLGRIIEEIVLKTRARCLILDPNADFRKVYEVETPSLWEKAEYKRSEGKGKLPHEPSWDDFASEWDQISIRIRTGASVTGENYEQLKLWWPSLDMQFLAEDIDPMYRSDLYHCHAFIKLLGRLIEYKLWATEKSTNLIDAAQRVFRQARALAKPDLREALEQEYNSVQLIGRSLRDDTTPQEGYINLGSKIATRRAIFENNINSFIDAALTVADYVSPNIERFYFGKAREYQAAGILHTDPLLEPWRLNPMCRLEVIDLPSLSDKSTRLLAINAILTTEWEQARSAWAKVLEKPLNRDNRVPTFIVVDEAHNLIPSEPRSKAEFALREQFRTFVAEGRKYGLFVILVSQRPDKLDPLVLSECENKAVMKLGAGSVLEMTQRMLGLDDIQPKLLERCLEFEPGRVLITGRWASDGPQIFYSAARRTVEGGRNLREDYWAVPVEASKILIKNGVAKKRSAGNKSKKKSSRGKKGGK